MAKVSDRWRDRLQIQIGGRWELMPGPHDSWREWAFSPFAGLTRVGQVITRRDIPPEGPVHAMLESEDLGTDPATNLKRWQFRSRVFWLRFGIRVLGLDVGFGVYYRARAEYKFQNV